MAESYKEIAREMRAWTVADHDVCEVRLNVSAFADRVESLGRQDNRSDERRQLANRLYSVGKRMRDAQKAYFTFRSPEHLKAAKAVEAEFDAVLNDCYNLGKPTHLQQELPLGSSVDDYFMGVPK